MHFSSLWLFCLLAYCAVACQPASEVTDQQSAQAQPFEEGWQRIHQAQDERNRDSIHGYLSHPQASYRYYAALAAGSLQDSTLTPSLVYLLHDSATKVRRAAAFALGQTGGVPAAQTLRKAVETEPDARVQAALLEAYGKVIDAASLGFFQAYETDDAVARAGLAWGLYRSALRQPVPDSLLPRVIAWLQDSSAAVRLAAAHTLMRGQVPSLNAYVDVLRQVARQDTAVEVRMAAAGAWQHVSVASKKQVLREILTEEPDERVKINAVRALDASTFPSLIDPLKDALQAGGNLAVAVAERLHTLVRPQDVSWLVRVAQAQPSAAWRPQALIYAAALRVSPDKRALRRYVLERYHAAESPYAKAQWLDALAEDPAAFDTLRYFVFTAASPIVTSVGLAGLVRMRQHPDFPASQHETWAASIRRGLSAGDVPLISEAAIAMRNPDPTLKTLSTFRADTSLIFAALRRLQLPRDYETYLDLHATLAFLKERPAPPVRSPAWNHPIDWDLLATLPNEPRVRIETSEGTVELLLLPEEAPGTVASFVALARATFFDSLAFHRVVPNFVVQGGSPTGNGWGSTDYTLRSEFSPRPYRTGSVGMASAGKDTEGCQWFITHSPTPHLDGRYTLFAEVVEGLEVVQQLAVGSTIYSVRLVEDIEDPSP